jgi:hypothetical protein
MRLVAGLCGGRDETDRQAGLGGNARRFRAAIERVERARETEPGRERREDRLL